MSISNEHIKGNDQKATLVFAKLLLRKNVGTFTKVKSFFKPKSKSEIA